MRKQQIILAVVLASVSWSAQANVTRPPLLPTRPPVIAPAPPSPGVYTGPPMPSMPPAPTGPNLIIPPKSCPGQPSTGAC